MSLSELLAYSSFTVTEKHNLFSIFTHVILKQLSNMGHMNHASEVLILLPSLLKSLEQLPYLWTAADIDNLG